MAQIRLAILGPALALLLGLTAPAAADDPAFLSFGVGYFDVNKQDDEAVDFRLEYRHDERWLGFIKPWAGASVTNEGGSWIGAGLLTDVFLGRRLVLTGSFAPGLWYNGSGKDLGHEVEFRSQIELGYRFNDRSRLALALSHLSNASLGDENPGVEVLTLYFHVPFHKVF